MRPRTRALIPFLLLMALLAPAVAVASEVTGRLVNTEDRPLAGVRLEVYPRSPTPGASPWPGSWCGWDGRANRRR